MSKSSLILTGILLVVLGLVAVLYPPFVILSIVRVLGIVSAVAAGYFFHKASLLP